MLTRNSKLHTDVNTSNIEHVQQIQQQKATGKQSSPSSTPLSKKKQKKKNRRKLHNIVTNAQQQEPGLQPCPSSWLSTKMSLKKI